MDTISKVEYNLRNLKTRSVTLFPSRAQISREIKDIPLHAGTNEITIFGLSPTVDEQSIKVEGSGSAIISDIAIESLPNRDIFEEIYPDSDEDKSDKDEEEDDDDDGHDLSESPELLAARERVQELSEALRKTQDIQSGAETRMLHLERFTDSIGWDAKLDIEQTMDSVDRAREKLIDERIEASKKARALTAPIAAAGKEVDRLAKIHRREKARATREVKKALMAKTKSKLQEARREEERLNEKERIRKERQSFWPKYCYAVRIQLIANVYTPTSSRRGSVSSDVDMAGEIAVESSDHGRTCDLVLSYVTTSAFWSPSYDLQLSTISATGTLCFDAQLNNTTSETWDKCKITLSTSQAASTALDETVPLLFPWHVKIGPKNANGDAENNLLYTREEKAHKNNAKVSHNKAWGNGKQRAEMFGTTAQPQNLNDYQFQLMLLEQQNKKRLMMARQQEDNFDAPRRSQAPQQQMPQQSVQQMAQQAQQMAQQQPYQQQQLPSSTLFGLEMYSMQPQPQQPAMATMMPQQQAPPNTNPFTEMSSPDGTITRDDLQQLDFQESLVEEMGFTTTYDLPGLKTLAPKSNSSKQRIARINFNNVIFSHAIIPKYKASAYLSAKMANNSKLTLLKGQVGVTLDGSFMGRTSLPRCGSGESVNLSLGVDPAIKVGYAVPEVKRATTGYFTKEDIKLYDRTIRLENTRTAIKTPVKLIISDQIPSSKDERVRIELLKPEGLVPGESSKSIEVPNEGQKDADWGTAKAQVRKTGTVDWFVNLKPGKSVKLSLEYLVATPIGDNAIQV